MSNLNEFISNISDYTGIFILMLSTFLIGYFSGWWMQKSTSRKLIERLKKQVNKSKINGDIRDIETIFTEIKPKIIEVVKKTQEEILETKSDEEIIEQTRTSYLTFTQNKPELDFDSFGYADSSSSEDLTKINGIGPYIEQKLNEIGIFNYEQISRFKNEDIRVLTEIIDFFPGRIERDDWVGQAEELKDY